METIMSILGFLRERFFYSPHATITTLCLLFAGIFFFKLLKDKGDNIKKTLQYVVGTGVFFSAYLIIC